MKSGTHHIRSQRWQVKTTSTAVAFAVRQELRTHFDTRLLPAFERAFDGFAAGDQVLHIPSLQLHLQLREGSNLMAEVERLIEDQLQSALRSAIRTTATSDAITAATAGGPATRLVQSQSVAEHRRELLVEYLVTGRIAWQAESQQTSSVLIWLKEEAELLASDPQILDKLTVGTLEERLTVWFRLIQLLVPSTRELLLSRRAADLHGELVAMLRLLATQNLLGNYLQLRVAALVLALDAADLTAHASATLNGAFTSPIEKLLTECLAKLIADGNSDAALAKRVDCLLRRVDPNTTVEVEQEKLLGRTPSTPPARITLNENRLKEDVAWRVMAVEPTDAPQRPGLLVMDAGVILLHPFLARLFESTNIAVAGNRSLPVAELPRAAALLHWLVTGRDDVFEFELSVIKLLLGLPPADPLVVAQGLLSDGDRAEGNAVLAAVIEHWTAIRNTTVAGLRASFLGRRGLLREGDAGWWLRVESESFDLLLGQLPWGISLVKLPWMTKPIFTDWPTP